jgi:hypothetical protein
MRELVLYLQGAERRAAAAAWPLPLRSEERQGKEVNFRKEK